MRMIIFALLLAISYAQTACGNLGTFMTNEGQTITMEPYAIRDFYVFGMKERQYFKMSSVDAEGNWIENRYSRLEMTPTMTDSQREQIWDSSYSSFDYGFPKGYSVHDVSIGCTPFKRKVVKELLERVEEAVRKTKTIVRKKVQQIQNSFNEPGSNYNDDEIGMIEQIANRIDDNEVAGFRMMMDAIDHLKYHYYDNGESRNRHNDDKIRKRWVKKLFRVIGDKHMLQFKAYLNRKMNEIEKNENLLYATLSNSVGGLAELTARRGSTAHEWLVHAEEQRYELSIMYDRNGNPRSP